MRKAVIEDSTGNVENVIELEDTAAWTPPVGRSIRDADENAEPGGHWDGSVFTRKPIIPPDPKVLRRIELEQRMLMGLASPPDVQEFLVLRFKIVASKMSRI